MEQVSPSACVRGSSSVGPQGAVYWSAGPQEGGRCWEFPWGERHTLHLDLSGGA